MAVLACTAVELFLGLFGESFQVGADQAVLFRSDTVFVFDLLGDDLAFDTLAGYGLLLLADKCFFMSVGSYCT